MLIAIFIKKPKNALAFFGFGLHDFVKALPVTKSVCTRKAPETPEIILTGVWGFPATLTLFEAVS